ncbi:hypothetical protein XENTR_v10004446 [Xenopus tropicalis]|nr:hypothetical protein XENTR_v10004446 [Xenopus tropicalis]
MYVLSLPSYLNLSILTSQFHIQTSDPHWNQSYSFLIKDPHTEKLELVVKDRHYGPLGSISVPISKLLKANNLSITDWYELCPSEPRGAILVKLELWILVPPNGETQESKVPSSQQPQCKDVNKRRAGPRLRIKRRLPFRKKLRKPKRFPKAATVTETTNATEQPELRRETNGPVTSTEPGQVGKKTIQQKGKELTGKLLQTIRRSVCRVCLPQQQLKAK